MSTHTRAPPIIQTPRALEFVLSRPLTFYVVKQITIAAQHTFSFVRRRSNIQEAHRRHCRLPHPLYISSAVRILDLYADQWLGAAHVASLSYRTTKRRPFPHTAVLLTASVAARSSRSHILTLLLASSSVIAAVFHHPSTQQSFKDASILLPTMHWLPLPSQAATDARGAVAASSAAERRALCVSTR